MNLSERPGCFGAASIYSRDSNICQACPAFEQCGDTSLETLIAIKDIIKVEDLLKRHDLQKKAAIKAKQPRVQPETRPLITSRPHIEASPVMPAKIERETKQEKVAIQVNDTDMSIVETMPKKEQPRVLRIIQAGVLVDAVEKMRKGENPFDYKEAPTFFRLAARMLLKDGFTRASLKQFYIANLGWAESTAGPHVSSVVAFFPKFGLAVEGEDGTFTLPR